MTLDIRKIDVRYRCCAVGVILTMITALASAMAYMWLSGRSLIEYSVGAGFGMMPSFSLCDRAEHPVFFERYDLRFSDSSYKKVDKAPRFNVKHVQEVMKKGSPDTTRRCLHFISKEDDLELDLSFKVSFKEQVNATAPRQFADIFTDTILNAHLPGDQMIYAGNLAILPSYGAKSEGSGGPDPPMMTALRLEKVQTTTASGTVYIKYVSKDTRVYHLHDPSLPETLVPNPAPVEGPLRVVQWDIFVPQPRVVQKHKEIPLKEQIIKLVARVGGALTMMALCFQLIFPRKYGSSSVAATMEMRTLRGFSVQEKHPTVDPEREHFGEWRFFQEEAGAASAGAETEMTTRR